MRKKSVVLVVCADPEPHDVAIVHYAKSAIVDAYAYRVHRRPLTHALEPQARVTRIQHKEAVGLPSLSAHMIW